MGNKGLGKKLLVYLMTFMMVFSTMPVNVFAVGQRSVNTNEGQIGNHYAVDDATGELPAEPSLSGNTQQSYEDGKVKVNKTISATGTENVFDVELTVETTQDVSTVEHTPDAAAVILIDCSNSMYACMACKHKHNGNEEADGSCETDNCDCTLANYRASGAYYAAAKAAAQAFIEEFTADDAVRKIAIVEFYGGDKITGAQTTTKDSSGNIGWANATSTNEDNIIDALDSVEPKGATNLHAGMLLAQNLLNHEDVVSIPNKSVVLISDGAPTRAISESSSELGNTDIDKISVNGAGTTGDGTGTSHYEHTVVEEIAYDMITNKHYSLYAAYIGQESFSCQDDTCKFKAMTGETWLRDHCKFSTSSANNTDEIVSQFEKIVELIEKNAQAWTVIDPMGPYVDYVSAEREAYVDGEFSVTNDQLVWDLRKAEDLDSSDDSYKYSLKYRVKLDNLSEYVAEQWTNMNDVTKLKYVLTTKVDGEQTSAKEGTAYFNIPSVKGYQGDEYSFNKVDDEGNPVEKAVFTLTTEDDPSWSMSATSDANGNVVFKGIPSGHTYSLEESSVPTEYKPSGEKHTMVVSYGQVTVDGSTDSIEVVNEKKQTTTVSGTKTWVHNGSNNNRPSEITLYLYANGELVESDVLEDGKTNPLTVKGNNKQNKWEYSFGQLPAKDSNGNTIKYTVLEKELDRYYPTYDGYNITNTRQDRDKTSVTVLKTWDDANDKDELRPESVTVKLTGTYRAGGQQHEVTSRTATLNVSNNWTYTFTDLDEKYKAWQDDYTITYTVSEVTSVNGYTTETGTVSNGIVTITNTHVPKAPADVLIKVTKDLDGRDWIDSDSFSFTLKNDSLGINDSLTLTKDKKSGTFDSIEIDKPGEYTFKIKENIPSNAVDGKLNGITYDRNNERTVKVTVTDNGEGQLVANITGDTYTGDNGEVFTNIYAPTPVQLPISGTKVMEGKTLNAGDFEFIITAAEGTPMPANTTVNNGVGEDIDRFTFGSIEYTQAGKYTYTIKETKGSAPGVAYDNSEITATVTVAEDQATGTLSANVVYKKGEETLNGLMFTNRYTVEPSDEVAFSASKKVTGHAYDLKADKFSFTLSPSEDNGDNDPIKNDITVTNDENGGVSFIEDVVYTEPGTYKYSVTENQSSIKGITYDNSTYLITVVVNENTQTAKLDTEITITKDGEPADAIVFSNNYKPDECTAVIKGKKSLSGKGMEAFTFQITQHQSTPNAPLPQYSEVQNDTAGVFEFNYGNITYTEAGTYVYEVTEKAVDKAGYTYDQSKYIVTVTVTDVNGELKSAVKYEKNGEEKAEMTFANDYTPEPVEVSIDGEKSLTGRDLNEGEFTFKLLDAKGEAAATAVNGGNGKFLFSDLTFTGTGTYTYTVVEDKSGAVLPGVTYSNEIYNVIIDVTDQNYDGQLDAAVKYYKNDSEVNGIEFTNTYEPAPAKLTLSGTKTFTGRDMKAGESFEFVLSADKLNANVQSLLPNGMTVNVRDGENGVPMSFAFGELTFTEPGTYRFDVNETKPDNTNGIIYDTDTVNVTVKVDHDVNNGRLVVSEVKYNEGLFDKENGIAFENTFEPVSAVFEAEKVLSGRDLKDGEFTFQLVDANGNVIQEKTNDADGNIVFDAIEYDGTGNHTYTINEVQGDLGGVSYDNVPVNVTATVTVDDRTEKLVAVTAYEKNGSDNAVFNNSYTTGSIEVGLTGQKVLTGRDLEAGEFSFVLKDDDGNVLQTKENAAGGSITFDAVKYTQAGTYNYTISEVKSDKGGIAYDDSVINVEVVVSDNGKGALSSSVTYSKGGETAAFTNTYSAAPASLSFSGSKVLTGRTLNEDEFSFVLKDAAGEKIETVTNTANGTISFDAIEYTEAGTYTYTISEIKGDLPGITYDEETVYVTVTVTDDGDGELKAEAKYKKGPNGEEKGTFAFENAYQTAPADPVSVEAKKSVETNTGDRYVLKDGEFTFQIIPGQNPANDPVSAGTTKNDIKGMIKVFSNAVYEQAGTYTYTLLETNSGVPGFGYSTTKYEIKVDVSDDIAKAKLNADVTLTDITDPKNPIVVEELVFVNTYDTKAATANIYGKKTVDASEGNSYTLKGGEFTFMLTPENENTPMPSNAEVTNLDTGAFTFGEIKYVRPGTYKYTVSEKAGKLQGFTYSDKEYNVTVTVTDVNSVLVAEVTGITDADGKLKIDFTNEYDPEPVEVAFDAMKVMETSDQEYALEGGDYNFQLKDSAKNIMQNKKNDADGTVSFDSIKYTKPGKYTYYVSEEKGNDENLIYDDTVYQVDVTVIDNNGKLEAVVKAGDTVIEKPADMIFTNVYETVSINGTKVWDDASDQDGIRPDKVTVKLLVGEEVVATKEISGQGDVWNWTFDNLPKYKNGSQIQYSVAETDVPDGYTKTVSGDQTNGFTITNKHTPETTEVSVAKVWDDADNQDNIRPASITVQLKSGNDVVDEFILNEANKWTATASTLDKYAEGEKIKYTWAESAVPAGYTLTDTKVEGDLTTFTNTHTPETTSVTVTKAWDDAEDQDGLRPGSVEVQLYANSKAVGDPIKLKGADWTHTWTDLDKKSGGRDIVYTVDEVKVPDGYTKTVSGDQTQGFTITNKHTPETTEVLVEKVWNDRNNQDGLRPASITVQLKANGNNEGAAVTLDANNNWQYRWTDLDKKSEGNDIAYTVDEVEVPEGYTKTVSGDQTQGFTITNEHTPETTEVMVKKVWDDGADQDGLRPDSITVQLKANGNNEGDTVILTANNNWQYKWTDLDKKSGGKDIAYTVDEVKVPDGYTKTVSGDQTNGFTITNTHKPLVTDISVNKVWNDKDNQDNKRPSSVTVQLFVGETAVSEKIVLDESNMWQHTWTNLAVNNSGNKIEYTVKELNKPDEYYYITSGSIEEGFTITNSYPVKKIDITAIKEWSDRIDEDKKRPDSVTIQLTANGENIGDPVVLDKNNNWQTVWNDLDCYKDGKLINYRVIETKVPDGYTHEITRTANYTGEGDDKVITGYHFNVNNIYPIPKTTVSVSKAWDDADNQDGIRPEAVKVNLIANGETVGAAITLNKDNKWSYTWSDLNIYSNGSKITYTVEEVDVEKGYRPEVTGSVSDGFVITNKHKPAETSVTVTKKWEDNKNQDGMRPENVEVILSANGKQVGSSIELDKDNNWTHTWTGLAKNANGEPINYTVDEVEVPDGYTKSVAKPVVNEDGTVKCTITNSHVPMTTKVSVEKVWRDGNDQDGIRPASINVILKADGQQVGTAVTLNSQNNWKHTWENLAVKNAGSDIEYTVEEKAVSEGKNEVENYTAEITGDVATGFTIINTHKPAETSFRVTKAWDDTDNQDNIRPDSITVQLYANGSKHGEPVALGEANGWSYKWTELAKYENGVEIVYTVDETAIPDGYTKDVKGSTITNTHVPEVTQVTFTKKWVDNDNQDGKRPSNIQVQLYADGDKVGSPVTVTAADNWTYTWKDLAKNSAGEAITYTAKEVEVPDGYNASADGMTITNTHTPETINIEGTKTWKDNDDQDGVRPASITVRLLANGEEVRSAVVTEDDDWSWLFEDLPKYEGGKVISYVITEDAVQDYSTAIEGYDITNTHAPGKTSITVTKSWNDRNDIAKVRPAKVSIQLYADGEPYGEAVTLDAKGNWSYTWAELDLKKAGKVIEYTVEEVDVPKGYEAEVTGDPTTGYIVTNTVDPKIIEDAIDTGDGSTPWGFGIASLFALCAAAGALFFRRRTE